jgi:hypothetical protein
LSSERDCENWAECGCTIIVVTFKAQIDLATARGARNRSNKVRNGRRCVLVRLPARAISQVAARASEPNRTHDNLSENQRQKHGIHARCRERFRYANSPVSLERSTHLHIVYTYWRSVGLSLSPPLRQRRRSRSPKQKFSGEPERNETHISATPCGVQLNPRTFRRAALARESNCCAPRANLPFSSVSVFFRVRSEQAPGLQKNVDPGFGERNAVVATPTHKVAPKELYVTDESC